MVIVYAVDMAKELGDETREKLVENFCPPDSPEAEHARRVAGFLGGYLPPSLRDNQNPAILEQTIREKGGLPIEMLPIRPIPTPEANN